MRHLLLIEDNRLVRELLEAYLAEQGYDVTALYDGMTAERALQSGTFDAVIVDAVLPRGTSGLEVANSARGRGIPVLVTSGWPETVAKLNAEPHPFLQKPFHLTQLSEALKLVLSANRERPSLKEQT